MFDEREWQHLIEIWAVDHIMLGTDHPFDMAEPDLIVFLGRVKGVRKQGMALVAGGNAARLRGPAQVAKAGRQQPFRHRRVWSSPCIALFADAAIIRSQET